MNTYDSFFSYLDDDEIIQVTRDLISIPSITHREGRGMVNYFEHWFKDIGIPFRTYPCEGNRANFFADYGAVDGAGRFLFNGHHDTKPVDGMTVDPFGGIIKNGRMYGRGTADMKGAIAAMLCAFKALVRGGFSPKGGITFYSDLEEEFGGTIGFSSMYDQGLIDGFEGMISGEPSGLEVHVGNLGGLTATFEILGKASHSALPYPGRNVIQAMAHFITEFIKLPYLQVESSHFGRSTVNFELIKGGLYSSTFPGRCFACLDSRLIPETPPEMAVSQYRGLMEHLNHEDGIVIREIDPPTEWRPRNGTNSAVHIPADHPLTLRAVKAVKAVTGKDPRIGSCPGSTYAGFMIRNGKSAVIIGPGSILQAHTEDEWVLVDELLSAARIYTALMADM